MWDYIRYKIQLFAAAKWSRSEAHWTLTLNVYLECNVPSSFFFLLLRINELGQTTIYCRLCDSDTLSPSRVVPVFLLALCVGESETDNSANIIGWPQPADVSSPVADALHGFGRGERSGKLQRHHRVWTAAAWPLQVGTRHVAHTSLHYTRVLPRPWWRQSSSQRTFKQNRRGPKRHFQSRCQVYLSHGMHRDFVLLEDSCSLFRQNLGCVGLACLWAQRSGLMLLSRHATCLQDFLTKRDLGWNLCNYLSINVNCCSWAGRRHSRCLSNLNEDFWVHRSTFFQVRRTHLHRQTRAGASREVRYALRRPAPL